MTLKKRLPNAASNNRIIDSALACSRPLSVPITSQSMSHEVGFQFLMVEALLAASYPVGSSSVVSRILFAL